MGQPEAPRYQPSSLALLALLTLSLTPSATAQIKQKPVAPPPEKQDREEEEEKPGTAQRRAEWFHNQRAYPLKSIPPGARLKSLEQLDQMLIQQGRLVRNPDGSVAAPAAAAVAAMWTPIGPQPANSGSVTIGPVSGRVTALAVDPTNPDIAYAGAAFGGIWKTTDGGMNWAPLTDGEVTLAVGSIAIDPTSCSPAPCKIIYVGTGEEDFAIDSYYGAGVLKSTDGGQTWTQLGQATFVGPFSGGFSFSPGGGARIGAIAVHPSNGQILLAGVQIFVSADTGTSSGIYRSTNGGSTWAEVLPGAAGTQVLFDPTNGNTAYAALGTLRGDVDNGVYKSTDAGATWTRMLSTSAGRIALALGRSNTSILYASIADAGASNPSASLLGVFRSMDGGTTWTVLTGTPDFCNPQCWYDNVIAVHPNNSNVVYAGGSATANYFMRSTDGGTTWTAFQLGANNVRLHVDQHAMAFGFSGASAVRLYAGNDGGVWSTDVSNPTSATINWTNLNGNGVSGSTTSLNTLQFYPGISIHPTNANAQPAYGGTQDNGTLRFSGILLWPSVTCGDGGWTAIDPQTPTTVYAACQYDPPNTGVSIIRKSTQDGLALTFSAADTGITKTERGAFIPPFVIDPSIPQPNGSPRLYFGTFRIWQTTDGAASWAAISPSLTTTSSGDVSTIAVAPSNSNTVYAGTDDGGVSVCTTAGTACSGSWLPINTGLPGRVVTQITVDPANSATAYVSFSGFAFGADTQGHVFRTTNGGTAWTDISGNLPNTPVNDIVVDPDFANTLYVATDIGVFMTSNANAGAGTTWTPINPASPGIAGLPRVAVLSLKLHEASRTLRAATHGRGMWDLALSPTPTFSLSATPANPSVQAGQPANFSVTVTAQNGFSGVVSFSVTGLPVGAGASFNPTTVTGSGSTSLTVTTAASTPAGAFPLTITGTSASLQASTQVSLTVTAPPDFSMSANPTSLTQTAGTSSSFTITVAAQNGTFSSAVALTFTGCPPLSTCSFNPASVTPGAASATSTFSVLTSATGGVPNAPRVPPYLVPVLFVALLSLWIAARRRLRPRLAASLGVLLLLFLVVLKTTGCGGGAGGGGGGGGGGTTRGTFTITVTGTSGATVHSTSVTLTVQ